MVLCCDWSQSGPEHPDGYPAFYYSLRIMSLHLPFKLSEHAIAQINQWFKCQISARNMPVSSACTRPVPKPASLQHVRLNRPVLHRFLHRFHIEEDADA